MKAICHRATHRFIHSCQSCPVPEGFTISIPSKKSFFDKTQCVMCRTSAFQLSAYFCAAVCARIRLHTNSQLSHREGPIPCFKQETASCCSHSLPGGAILLCTLLAPLVGYTCRCKLAGLLLHSALDILLSLHQLMPRTLHVQHHMLHAGFNSWLQERLEKNSGISTLHAQPAEHETTSCGPRKKLQTFALGRPQFPKDTFFTSTNLNHIPEDQLRPPEVARPVFNHLRMQFL